MDTKFKFISLGNHKVTKIWVCKASTGVRVGEICAFNLGPIKKTCIKLQVAL